MSRLYRRPFWAVLALGLFGSLLVPAALGAAGAQSAEPADGAGDERASRTRTYLVTVENLTDGQPFTPPVAATHSRRTKVFRVGERATRGIRGLAENGDVAGLVAELDGKPRVGEIVVADEDGPVLPGASVSFEITSTRGHRNLSLASMLICTNDGFTGIDNLRLPAGKGDQTVVHLDGYDAGTEVNTEDFDDLVPPCGPLTGVDSGGAGTGASNPALFEGAVIGSHDGIDGSGDLTPAIHDWADPVAKVTITRIDGAAKYELSVANGTDGQPFTPPVAITHGRRFDLFDRGEAASPAIQGLAENGDVPGLVAAADGATGVRTVFAAGAPVLGGEDATYTFYTRPFIRRLTVASMLICTNDGFTGVDSVFLPVWLGQSRSFDLRGYDAGTEVNTEDFDDLVPPCGPLTGVDSGGAGTGASNPALAEGGVIGLHAGIDGGSDLVPGIHGWTGPVGELTITRVG